MAVPVTHARWLVALALVVVLLPSAVTGAAVQPAPRVGFGLVDAHAFPDAARELGIQWERITFEWVAFQPDSPHEFITSSVRVDWLAEAQDAGRRVVGLITSAPPWASESGASQAVPAGLDLPIDHPANAWAAFITRLVHTYAPRGIHDWIIYDRPNIQRGEGPVQFAGSVEDYARLLSVASQAARDVDPGARLFIAGMDWWADDAAGREPYLARLLRVLRADSDAAGRSYDFDGLVVRGDTRTADVWDILSETRGLMESAGIEGKAVWLQTALSPTLDPALPVSSPLFGVSLGQQADFVIQASALGLAAGVEGILWYRLADDPGDSLPWGLLRADGTRRPAFDAYALAVELFSGTVSATRFENRSVALIVLEGQSQDVYVMWARGTDPAQVVITSPAVAEGARLTLPDGITRRVASEPVEWPAAFTVDLPPARTDANGFLTAAGSPRILVLDKAGGFFRVGYALANDARMRIK